MQRALTVLTLASVALAGGPVFAQGHPKYPERPIRVLVGFVAGGAVDLTARTIGLKLAERVGQPVVVDNRPGASGAIAMKMAAQAQPDGYTLLLGSSTQFSIGPAMHDGPFYEPLSGFTPLARAVVAPIMLTVHPSVQSASVKELIAFAKTKPGQLSFATPGAGSGSHIAGELFARAAGVSMTHVPYKGGGAAIVALVGGHVPISFGAASTAMPHLKSGKLRALGIAEARRLSSAPEIPTIAEAGLPGFEVSQWYGFFAPARIPAAVTKKLSDEAGAILALPDVKERFSAIGLEITYQPAGPFAAYVKSEAAKWAKLLKEMGITAQ